MKIKELYWFFGTLVFTLITVFFVFDLDSINPSSFVDINVHDTYFVIPASYMLVLFSTIIFFVVYLIRVLHMKFKNITANVIFLIANVLLALKFTQLISIFRSLDLMKEIPEYPSSSDQFENGTGEILRSFSNYLLFAQLLFLILLVYCGVKIGLNYKRKE